MSGRLQIRLLLAIVIITGLGVALSGYLNYAKFESTYTELEASRYQFITRDIVTTVENEMDLGVDLHRLTNATQVLERAAARDRGIRAVVIFNTAGQPLFETGTLSLGETVPAAWAAQVAERGASSKTFQDTLSETLVVGHQLINNLGSPVGGVALLYTRAQRDNIVQEMSQVLFHSAWYILLIAALSSYLGVRWSVRRASQRITSMSSALRNEDQNTDEDLKTQVATVDAEAHKAIEELNAVEKSLQELAKKA